MPQGLKWCNGWRYRQWQPSESWGSQQANDVPSPSVYCASGKSFWGRRKLLRCCHLPLLTTLTPSFCFHGGPALGALPSPLYSLPENSQEIRTSLDKWIRCGPGSSTAPAGADKVWSLRAHVRQRWFHMRRLDDQRHIHCFSLWCKGDCWS